MRQEHRAGEKVFVDYAGQKVPVTDPRTGQVTEVPVFVATLGASSYTYVEVTAAECLCQPKSRPPCSSNWEPGARLDLAA